MTVSQALETGWKCGSPSSQVRAAAATAVTLKPPSPYTHTSRPAPTTGAGRVLFTTRPFTRDALITEYQGSLVGHTRALALRDSNQHRHLRALNLQVRGALLSSQPGNTVFVCPSLCLRCVVCTAPICTRQPLTHFDSCTLPPQNQTPPPTYTHTHPCNSSCTLMASRSRGKVRAAAPLPMTAEG